MYIIGMCGVEKKLVGKVLAKTFFIPIFMILFVSLEGNSLSEALDSCIEVFFGLPHSLFSWGLVVIIDLIVIIYMKPVIKFWGAYKRGEVITPHHRNKAMEVFNNLNRNVLILTSLGFITWPGMYLLFNFKIFDDSTYISNVYILVDSLITGVFTGLLINMNLSNSIFEVKRALMEEPPSLKPRYISFYKQLMLIIIFLLAFLGFRVFTITAEFFEIAVKMASPEVQGSMGESIRPEELFMKMGQNHDFIKSLIEVVYLKFFIFLIIAFRTLGLIKGTIKNPLETVEDRLDALSSDNRVKHREIAVVNNDEFSNIFNDINKLIKMQESELEQSQNRLHSIIDSAADPIISFNEKGYIYIFNPAAEDYFGWSRSDIKGRSFISLFDPEADVCRKCGSDDNRFIETITSMNTPLQRFVGITSNKKKVQFEANFSANETPDGVIYTAIIRDVSKQLEFENSLKEAKQSAERANTLKSEFLANMSHELRTPLNAVLGFTQLLTGDKNLTDSQLDKINTISRSGEHLLGLINDILDISKIEAGKIELHMSNFNLRNFVEDIKQMFELKCKKKGLTLYVEYVDPVPEFIYGDLGKIRQILINIIGNAVKFTNDGGISLVVGMKEDGLGFSISDTGKGIPENEIESILKPFTQSSMMDHEGGTGLGLAITNSFINMMGGKLVIESKVGRGSTFSFTLNLEEGEQVIEKDNSEGRAIGIKGNISPKILIVDDKTNNRLILKEMLENVGFTTMEANDGKVAIERTLEFKPDLIFMDIKMPVMDGYGAVKELKIMDETKAIPVFALTASAFKHDEASILKSGFDGFLAKPFKLESLFNLITTNTIIEFEYERATQAREEVSLDNLDFKSLSKDIDISQLDKLEDLVLINDFPGINKFISQEGLGNISLESVIKRLADDFDDEKLEMLIENIKENK